jgi:glycosyltransferase involved in cell wall biosynthesis
VTAPEQYPSRPASTAPAPEDYDVSVIVPTHNRAALLGRTLDTLLAQQAPGVRYEIVVVDNNSRDNTRDVVGAYSARSPLIRYVFEPRPGVSHARNSGVRRAGARLLAFIDDDIEASPDWVATITRTFDRRPDVDCIGGRIEPRWSEPPPAWLTSQHWGAVALQADKGTSPVVDAEHASPCLMTANFACRREAYEAVGGFSPEFLRDEDREMQLRLWSAGKRGLYVPELQVTAEVAPERLRKPYHRAFNFRVGVNHARMGYRERVDRDGRLVRDPKPLATLFGTPGFVFREMLSHVTGWLSSVARGDSTAAFFHEVRLRYFAGYVLTRARQRHIRPWAAPLEVARFAGALLAKRRAAS